MTKPTQTVGDIFKPIWAEYLLWTTEETPGIVKNTILPNQQALKHAMLFAIQKMLDK